MLFWIEKTAKEHKVLLSMAFLCLFIYTMLRFLSGGIYYPLKHMPNMAQVEEEISPLVRFLSGGQFVFDNTRQYGPFFIFLITPFMILYRYPAIFEIALLLFEYFFASLSFYICYKSIFPIEAFNTKSEKRIVFWSLLFLWVNFVPLICIIAAKNVEVWELFLICFGFLMYKERKFSWAGFSFAAATLIKLLPALFIFYYFFKKRKIFLYSVLWIIIIIAAAHFVYGPNIGLLYLPFLFSRPFGSQTFAAAHCENTAIKGLIYKVAAGFKSNTAYLFPSSPEAERVAFLATTIIQIGMLIYLASTALRKKCSADETLVQFSIVSVFMILLAPVATFEYNTLLLFAYSAGMYFIFYRNLPKYLLALYGLSYLLVGVFFPLSLVTRLLPFKVINIYFGNTFFTMEESYKAYCMPLLGVVFLAIFFIIIWHNSKILKTMSHE